MTRMPYGSQPRLAHVVAAVIVIVQQFCAVASGQTITVNTVNDVVDFGGAQQVQDLPGPDGKVSFREAVKAANNTPGPQTINFAIPPNEFSTVALLRLESGAFVLTDDATTINFASQTAATGDTNPNGNEVGIFGMEPNGLGTAAIIVNANNCLFQGLDVVQQRGYAIQLRGNGNRVIGCTISGPLYAAVYINGTFNGAPATGNIVGGTLPGEGNSLSAGNSGLRIDGPASGNVAIGNSMKGTFWGVEIRTPTCCPGNDAVNNRIGGSTAAERNVIAGAGKYGEEGFPTGGQVAVQYSTGNIVEGNYIGVNSDGATVPAVQRGPVGVEIRSSPGTIVRNNLISGILVVGVNHAAGQRFGNAINLMGDCAGSVIQSNRIGVAADSTTPLPNRAGIVASYWSVNGMPVIPGPVQIGGQASDEANVIANNETIGVRVDSQINRVRISGNSIHDNGALGIDLLPVAGGQGVTPNDPMDPDSGGNRLQNFPVIQSAHSGPTSITIEGTFNSTPNSSFELEFFDSDACDPSGFGEGRAFLGATSVTTDGAGNAAFAVSFPASVPPGHVVTATATSSAGDTSEFSACRPVTPADTGGVHGDANGDGVVNFDDVLAILASWGACEIPCPADLNGDGMVNFDDVLVVLASWT